MKGLPNWDVWNNADIIEMLLYLSTYYGDDCADCKVVCCANQFLNIDREEIKTIAEHLKMDVDKFRLKHTILVKNLEKRYSKKFEKDVQIKTRTESAKRQMNKGGRLLLFDDSDDTIMIGENESLASYCPFYNRETHRCKIHNVRPDACRQYPYETVDKWLDLRKVNACLVATNFLSRFSTLMRVAGASINDILIVIDDIDEALASKEYHSHYPIHWLLVIQYLILEFAIIGEEKLALDLRKRVDYDMEVEKERYRRTTKNI